MKLQAKQRLELTAAPVFTKLFEVARDLVEKNSRYNINSASVAKLIRQAASEAIKEIGASRAQAAETALQKDYGSEVFKSIDKSKPSSAIKPLNEFVEAFWANWSVLEEDNL